MQICRARPPPCSSREFAGFTRAKDRDGLWLEKMSARISSTMIPEKETNSLFVFSLWLMCSNEEGENRALELVF